MKDTPKNGKIDTAQENLVVSKTEQIGREEESGRATEDVLQSDELSSETAPDCNLDGIKESDSENNSVNNSDNGTEINSDCNNESDSENMQTTENIQAEKVCQNNSEKDCEEVKRVPRKRNKLYMCFYAFTKRLFDFLSSLAVSILISPILLIVTIIMLFKSFGNPIYKQKRLGRKGKVLKIYKFRSMRKGADNLEKFLNAEQLEEYKREYKLKDDPRLIGYKKAGDGEFERCFGAKIRKTSIDELPQIFFNICILGNMSVVGPRPILPDELEKNYTKDEQKLLLSAKPGLTGYWQAYARNNATYKSGERQKMELYYVENRSLGLDIKILFKTIISVLKKDGAE